MTYTVTAVVLLLMVAVESLSAAR